MNDYYRLHEITKAYGQGVKDTIAELSAMPHSDREAILGQARTERDAERFVLCPSGKHYLLKTAKPIACPYCWHLAAL